MNVSGTGEGHKSLEIATRDASGSKASAPVVKPQTNACAVTTFSRARKPIYHTLGMVVRIVPTDTARREAENPNIYEPSSEGMSASGLDDVVPEKCTPQPSRGPGDVRSRSGADYVRLVPSTLEVGSVPLPPLFTVTNEREDDDQGGDEVAALGEDIITPVIQTEQRKAVAVETDVPVAVIADGASENLTAPVAVAYISDVVVRALDSLSSDLRSTIRGYINTFPHNALGYEVVRSVKHIVHCMGFTLHVQNSSYIVVNCAEPKGDADDLDVEQRPVRVLRRSRQFCPAEFDDGRPCQFNMQLYSYIAMEGNNDSGRHENDGKRMAYGAMFSEDDHNHAPSKYKLLRPLHLKLYRRHRTCITNASSSWRTK